MLVARRRAHKKQRGEHTEAKRTKSEAHSRGGLQRAVEKSTGVRSRKRLVRGRMEWLSTLEESIVGIRERGILFISCNFTG